MSEPIVEAVSSSSASDYVDFNATAGLVTTPIEISAAKFNWRSAINSCGSW
ncbi:hypothetical protein [Chamaesiphon polymorphus]|uniref:hypothetical protein n=1 Tax=Chamaesiphon polymorphus TaxID=2107691 RepID=UPI0015E6CDF4|nr:hypothetical protein [Chamaesiphon polymorphus]